MHMTIGAIVYAESEKEAEEKAALVFESLVDEGVYDYFSIYSAASPDNRDEMWTAEARSTMGHDIIELMMDWTREEFERKFERVKKAINRWSASEIMEERPLKDEEEFDQLIRHWFYCLGQYKGGSVWLYDYQGEGIRNRRHLNDALDKWPGLTYEKPEGRPWIVPADVHL